MSAPNRKAGLGAAALVLSTAALSVAGQSAVTAAPDTSSTLSAAGNVGTTVTGAGQVAVDGDTKVDVGVVETEGGEVRVAAGPDASLPRAWRFPSFAAAGLYPRAVLGVTPTTGEAMSPGSSDFAYGAVFRLDDSSSGRLVDDGDNVFQRGRYADTSMFKLQVDRGRPGCLVRGSAGRVLVTSSVEITPDRWYRAVCTRVGSTLSVLVRPYGDVDATVVDRSDGPTGALSMPATRRASIGGKLTASGLQIVAASDQFNGAIAKVWVDRS